MDAIAARLNKVRAAREETGLGLNVRFLREDGTADQFSFGDVSRADAFRAKLARQGREILA